VNIHVLLFIGGTIEEGKEGFFSQGLGLFNQQGNTVLGALPFARMSDAGYGIGHESKNIVSSMRPPLVKVVR
jgi:hypothetical protein